MLENKYKQITISEHISLYDKIISKDNFLRKLKENIDFSFVNKLVEKEYSEKYGRPAKEPEMMYKLLFLEIKDSLSDREVIRRAETDMAYKYFLDLNPEDNVPSYSLLSVFRNTKIKDERILEEMLQETVKQAIEKGIIKMEDLINKLNLDNPYREKFEKDLKDKINMSRELLNNFDFEIIKKMTIMNSHGDYSVQQLIYNDNSKTTVIDFETAKKLPIIWEVLRSYSYIDEEAKNGELNIDTLVEYVKEFAKYVQLNEYDLKYAAQLYLIQIVSSPFGYKQYNDDYEKKGLLEFALFRTNLCRYLYNNSKEISTRLQKEVNGYTKV